MVLLLDLLTVTSAIESELLLPCIAYRHVVDVLIDRFNELQIKILSTEALSLLFLCLPFYHHYHRH